MVRPPSVALHLPLMRFDPLYNNVRHFAESWQARRGETATPFPCN
jgi:hypothetical protein